MADENGVDDSTKAEFEHLNEIYYSGECPSNHLFARWREIAFAIYEPEKLAALSMDYHAKGTHIIIAGHDHLDDDDRLRISREACVNLTVLFHQAAETLLRMYLAHSQPSLCPWEEIAGLRDYGTFKSLIEKRFTPNGDDKEEELASILRAFLGPSNLETMDIGKDERALTREALENIYDILSLFAKQFLEEAPFYNAIKHGMAVLSAEPFMYVNGFVFGSGPGLTCLHYERVTLDDGTKAQRLDRRTMWIDADCYLALVKIAHDLIERLWDVARARYIGADWTPGLPIFPPIHELLLGIMRENGKKVVLQRTSQPTGIIRKRNLSWRKPRSAGK